MRWLIDFYGAIMMRGAGLMEKGEKVEVLGEIKIPIERVMANGNSTLRSCGLFASPFSSPQPLHTAFKTPNGSGLCAPITQTHDLDLRPGCNPTALQYHVVTSLVAGEEAEPQVAPHPDTPSLWYSDAVQVLRKGIFRQN